MTIAASLPEAAGLAYDNLFDKFFANTLKAALTGFWQEIQPLFDAQRNLDHPMVNWISIISALATDIFAPPLTTSYTQLNDGVMYIFRACWMCNTTLYSATQQAGVLAAYNTWFG